MVQRHWEMRESGRINQWIKLEEQMFWFYDKLTNYYQQLTRFFETEELLALVFHDMHVKNKLQKQLKRS